MPEQDTKVVTGIVRLSYVSLFQRRKRDGDDGEGSYSVAVLVPKSDTETIAKLKKAREAAIKAKWGTSPPKGIKSTIKDGDDEEKYDHSVNPEFKGHLIINAEARRYAPGVVDRKLQPILDSTEVYSGCYARVSLNAFAWEGDKFGKGVSFGLGNVMKWEDGEMLAGVAKPEDDFADFADTSDSSDLSDMADLL